MEAKQIFELHDDIVERLSKLHDAIYDRADQLFKEHDLCSISNGKCLGGDFCCSGCTHLGPDGCITKSLACKLSTCPSAKDAAREHNREVLEEILLLRELARMHQIALFRSPKKKVFNRFVARGRCHT